MPANTVRFVIHTLTPDRTTVTDVEVRRLPDGRADVLIEEGSRKVTGKKWHTQFVRFLLSAEQCDELMALLHADR